MISETKKYWFQNKECVDTINLINSCKWTNNRKPVKNKEKSVGTKKIKLCPNEYQRNKLNLLIEQSRFVYNKLIESFYRKYGDDYASWANMKIGMIYGRKEWATKDAIKRKIKYGHVPKHLKLDTISGCVLSDILIDIRTAVHSTLGMLKNGRIHTFPEFKYKSYNESISIPIRKTDLNITENGVVLFPKLFKSTEPIKIKGLNGFEIEHDCRLQRLKNGKYYICIPIDHEKINNHKDNVEEYNVCSIDPGIRTLLTVFNPKDNTIMELGSSNDLDKLKIRLRIISALQSKIAKLSNEHGAKVRKIRNHLRRKIANMWTRIRNIRKTMHHNFSKIIIDRFDIIYLPKYEVTKFKMSNQNNKNAMLWSFFEFKQILKAKAKKYTNKEIIDCTEEYTSKVCSNCFKINENLGGSKDFICPHCHYNIDRDENGAVNILLKNLIYEP